MSTTRCRSPLLAVALSALAGCSGDALTPGELAQVLTMSPVPAPPPSASNRYADSPAAAAIGKTLFFDPGLSADGKTACATCHDPKRHFTDGERVHTALGTGNRNVPSVETAAWQTWFFWDGRADSAWAQATGPMRNPVEMGATAESVQARVRDVDAVAFGEAFGPLPEDSNLTLALVGKALEAYERTLGPGPARFDAFVADLRATGSSTVLTGDEQAGLRVFLRRGCVNCHSGPLFTDGSFHNIGVPEIAKGGMDIGRALGATAVLDDPYNCLGPYSDAHLPALIAPPATSSGPKATAHPCAELRFLDPSFPDWPLAFKTPSLRNVADTAPYMHDGSIATLAAVLAFYSTLPGTPLIGHRELTLQPLSLSQREMDDLEAFLGTLSSPAR